MAQATVSGPGQAARPSARKPPRRPRGALAAICALLVTSALLRAAVGASEAIAREETTTAAPPAPAPAHAVTESHAPAPKAGSDPAPYMVAEADLEPLIQALNLREERVRKREAAIEVRMQALSVAEQEIDRKLAALEEAETSLKQTLALARTAAEDDIAKLTEVYANMKPKQAAALFEEMDPDFAAGFLARMRPDAAAAIMAGMSPQAAYLTSVILAGRNADVPKE